MCNTVGPATHSSCNSSSRVSAERLKASGITDGLSFAFRQLSAGGGPKKIAERVEGELKQRYGAELSGPELEKKAQAELLAAMEAQLASEQLARDRPRLPR